MEKLPVFKLRIKKEDESSQEVDYVALVDYPAIEMNWQAFNKQFRFADDKERRIVMGPLMVADMPIYRKGVIPGTDREGEYYVIFDKQTIFDIVDKFFRNKYTDHFNIMHDGNKRTKDVYVIGSIPVDKEMGVLPPKSFEGISDGSWIGMVKVNNDEVWQDYIKTGKLKGFSVEGIFAPEYYSTEDEQILETIAEIVKGE